MEILSDVWFGIGFDVWWTPKRWFTARKPLLLTDPILLDTVELVIGEIFGRGKGFMSKPRPVVGPPALESAT